MSFIRYARKVDESQPAIVQALRKAGWYVWAIGKPVDLLVWRPGRQFRLLECKTPANKDGTWKKRKDQMLQDTFVEMTGTPRVTTPEMALTVLAEESA